MYNSPCMVLSAVPEDTDFVSNRANIKRSDSQYQLRLQSVLAYVLKCLDTTVNVIGNRIRYKRLSSRSAPVTCLCTEMGALTYGVFFCFKRH